MVLLLNDLLISKTKAIQQLEKELAEFQKQKIELDLLAQNAEADLATKIKTSDDAQPLLNEAKAIDVQLLERAEQITKASDEFTIANENYKEDEKQFLDQQEQAKLLRNSLDKLTKWKEENTVRQPVADNQNIIISKLTDAGKLLNSLKSISEEINKA